jgi:chaperonin GroEL
VEGAMHATKAAAEEGIVTGGGAAFVWAAKELENFKLEDPDEQVGVSIVKRALEEPLRQIANNAGHEGPVVVGKVNASDDVKFGFNAETEEYEDLVKAGVIDPTMVTRTALQNAASIASLLLTTEALVTEKPEKKDNVPAAPPDMGGMGGMY